MTGLRLLFGGACPVYVRFERLSAFFSWLKRVRFSREVLNGISLANRPEIILEHLKGLPGVQGVECRGGLIRVYADDLQRAGYAIFRAADEHGWKLENFRFETGTLDDLFVQLMERRVSA